MGDREDLQITDDTRSKQHASAENEAFLRERFNSLSRLVPVLYATIFIDALLLAWLLRGSIPIWAHALLTVSILAVVTTRAIYWLRLRGKAYELDLDQIRRAIRGTAVVGPLLSLVFSTVGFFLMRQGDATQQSMTLVSIWIVASASSFCVFSLPITAMLILLASSVPMVLSLLLNGNSQLVMETPALVAVAVLMIYILRENFRTFTEIVNSRTKLRELQDELGRSHKHLLLAQRVGGIGSAELEIGTGAMMWSDHFYTLLDLDPETAKPGIDAFLAAVHPDDLDMVREAVTRNHRGLIAAPMEFRVRDADGTERWLSWTSDLMVSNKGAAEGFVMTVHDITEPKLSELDLIEREAAVRRSNQHLARAQKLGKVGSNEFDPATGQTWWSDEQYAILGLEPRSTKPDTQVFLARVHPDDRELLKSRLKARAHGQGVEPMEYRIVHPDGEVRWVYGKSEVVRDENDGAARIVGTMHDITERKRVEAQLTQAQKMEAVGHLTGGIAHDFNNLFAVILGRLQMLDEELTGNPELRGWVRSSLKAIERGSSLTKSLLAFSRRQALVPVELDLNTLIDDLEDVLRRTLDETQAFHVVKAPGLWHVEVDPGQLQHALLNLVINARDAMPNGGTLTVATGNTTFEAGRVDAPVDARPGDYVVLSVSDTGVGMAREVADRAFEPFFTTKDVNKGSGLGLSMVYGFVKQSGGHVTIASEPGKGTTVRIYLPREIRAFVSTTAKSTSPRAMARGSETILVVEDNEELLQVIGLQLQRLGYTVLKANHGAEGLRLLRETPRVDLLLTDVIMPQGMNGPELAEQAVALRPDLKVEFMSGYSEQRDALEMTRGRNYRLLQKPFPIDVLAAEIRAVLDTAKAATGAETSAVN